MKTTLVFAFLFVALRTVHAQTFDPDPDLVILETEEIRFGLTPRLNDNAIVVATGSGVGTHVLTSEQVLTALPSILRNPAASTDLAMTLLEPTTL